MGTSGFKLLYQFNKFKGGNFEQGNFLLLKNVTSSTKNAFG
jgi:hypothetical protein